jgi:hypothetical protein
MESMDDLVNEGDARFAFSVPTLQRGNASRDALASQNAESL